MSRRYCLSLLAFSVIVSACQTPPPSSTLEPSGSPTAPTAIPFTETPPATTVPTIAAATRVPSATAPAHSDVAEYLRSEGPYLLAVPRSTEPPDLVYLDADGRGAARVALPEGFRLEGSLRHSLSSDGRYLVLYAGTAAEAPYDLRLGLFDLERNALTQEVALLSAAYPEDLRDLFRTRIAPAAGFDPADAANFQGEVGRWYLTIWDWSANGRYLAFAGQRDGPSTDVYVLDVQTGQVRRMTDGIEQVVSLEWSPDGRRILNGSSNDFGMGMKIHFWSADVATDTNVSLGTASAGLARWVSTEQVFLHGQTNGRFTNIDAQLASAVTGEAVTLWTSGYAHLSLDLESGTADVMGCPSDYRSDAECGRFTVDLTTAKATRTGDLVAPETYPTRDFSSQTLWDDAGNRLMMTPDRLEIETATGEILVPVGDRSAWRWTSSFLLSPNHAYAFLCDRETKVGWHVVELATGQVHSLNSILTTLTTEVDLAWVNEAPAALRAAMPPATLAPQDAAPRVRMLLGKTDGWELKEPLQTWDSQNLSKTTLPLPQASHPTWTWSTRLSPRHDYIAYLPVDRGDALDPATLARDDYQLWIQDTHTGVFVARVDLLSAAALEAIAKAETSWEGEIPGLPVMGVARALGDNLAWSPNGRYLAFTAASDGPTADLYIFDTTTRDVRRLTDESMSLGLIFWSPDSERVVARELLDYQPYPDGNCIFCSPGRTVVVVVAEGATVLLDGPLGIHLAGWSSSESFLAFAAPFEAPPMFLAEADLGSAEIQTVFPGAFADVAVAESTGDIWLSYWSRDPYMHFEIADGLYRLNRESGAVQPQALGAEWAGGLTYLREWDALAVWSANQPRTLRILNADGTERFRITGLDPQARVEDTGSWLMLPSVDRGWLIVDAQGHEVAVPGSGCVRWLPGHDGVLSVSESGSRLLRASHNWQPEPLDVPATLCAAGQVVSVGDP